MTNPVSLNPSSQSPPLSEPVVDSFGRFTTPWYRAWVGVWERTGGANGINSSNVEATAQEALTLATTAQATASLALVNATEAESIANTAQTSASAAASAANSAAGTAGAVAASALTKANNLSDVASASTSRVNLGLSIFPISIQFDTLTSGLTRYVPIVRAVTIPANLTGTYAYCGTVPTSDAVFTLKRIRSGVTVTLGTITIVHSGTAFVLSTQAQSTLNVGDIFVMVAPNPNDATLANVGITLLTNLT